MKLLRCLSALLLLPTLGEGAFPTLFLKNVCDNALHAPTNITNAGDGSGRLFFCDQPGRIHIFVNGALLPTPFLDLSSTGANRVFFHTGNPNAYTERGLLGMTFHPDFGNSSAAGYRRFYLNYTAAPATATANPSTPQNCVTIIAEYLVSTTNPNVADPASERILLSYGQPQSNHKGGQIEFGPDGLLYIGSGDGGSANDNAEGHTGGSGSSSAGRVSGTLGNAQDKTKLLGKLLRIDPLGTNGPGGQFGIPAGNPFAASVGTERKEIYAFGFRNPWRFSFDAPEGGPVRLICADVGQIDVEEVNLVTAGGNYGWRLKEGNVNFDTTGPSGGGTLIAPIAEYAHPGATLTGTELLPKYGTSITGGRIYRGFAIPAMQGKYLFGDYAANGIGGGGGILLGLEENTPNVFTLSQVNPLNALPASARIYAFGVDEDGEMYVATKTTSGVEAQDGGKPAGTLYKIVPAVEATVQLSANRDNTLYEPGSAGVRSNGKGVFIFAGKTGEMADYKVRRALLRFDLSPIPAGVTVTSANVRLALDQQVGQDFPMKLHRLNADWGEGNSNAGNPGGNGAPPQTGDATWPSRFHSATAWTTPGGDYVSAASSTYIIGAELSDPFPTWMGRTLATDVQSWLTTPANNFGWILIGDETQTFSAQRFISRESSTTSSRPRLTVAYASAPLPTHYEAWLALYYPTPGTFIAPAGDDDGDGIENQNEYAFGLNPLTAEQGADIASSTAVGAADSTDFITTFRRDSAATDIAYTLESSPDLLLWTPIATVTAGTSPLGMNGGIIDSDSPLSGTIRQVSVRENLTGSNKLRRFIRLTTERSQ